MALRKAKWLGISSAVIGWWLSSGAALAATAASAATKTKSSPNIFDDAVNSISFLINSVAHFLGNNNGFSYGLGLIVITLAIRLLTLPLVIRSVRNSKKMQMLQPRIKELREKYGKDRVKINEQMMAIYKEEGVNPVAGCMPMLVQMVVLWVLYRAIYVDPALMHSWFFGINLGQPDHTFILPVLAAITSYFQTKLTMVQTDPSQKFIMYIFPVMILFMGTRFNAALALYWVISNIFTIFQTYFTRVKPANQEA